MFCSSCGNALVASAKFCSSCGTAAEPQTAQDPLKLAGMSHADYAYGGLPAAKSESKRSTALVLTFVGVLLAIIVAIAFAISLTTQTTSAIDDGSNGDSSIVLPEIDTWSGPDGYTLYDTGIAYKWTTGTTKGDCYDCTFSTVDIVTQSGCSELCVEANFLDADGNNVGWTNDTAKNVKPDAVAKLEFDSYDANANTTEIAKVSCY